MRARLKRVLLLTAIFVPTVVLLVEWNRFMRLQTPACPTGECAPPKRYGLTIDPFPPEIVPQGSEANQPTNVSTGHSVKSEAPNPQP